LTCFSKFSGKSVTRELTKEPAVVDGICKEGVASSIESWNIFAQDGNLLSIFLAVLPRTDGTGFAIATSTRRTKP
jgi:hypothetical protein